jgi:hypothetical protein
MATSIGLRHPTSGLLKKGYYGFSWTYFFFGWFVPLVRGELGVAILHLILTFFTLGIWQIVFAFMYNKQYMTRMLEKGYVLDGNENQLADARRELGVVKLSL